MAAVNNNLMQNGRWDLNLNSINLIGRTNYPLCSRDNIIIQFQQQFMPNNDDLRILGYLISDSNVNSVHIGYHAADGYHREEFKGYDNLHLVNGNRIDFLEFYCDLYFLEHFDMNALGG